jgi:hypothetical protein
MNGDKSLGRRYGLRALELFRNLGEQRGQGATLNFLGMIALDWSHYEEARGYYLEARKLQQWAGHREQECYTLSNLAECERCLKNWSAAEQYLAESDALSRQIETDLVIIHNTGIRAQLAANQGNLPRSLEILQQILATEVIEQHQRYVCFYLARVAAMARILGDEPRAQKAFARVADVLSTLGEERYLGTCKAYEGACLAWDKGERDEIINHLADVLRSYWTGVTAASGYLTTFENCLMLRDAVCFVWPTIDASSRREIEALARDPSCQHLVVTPCYGFFRLPEARTWSDIRNRQNLVQILALLVVAHGRETSVDERTILENLWPDEVIEASAGLNRIHNAIALLRRAGLKSLLLRREQGYYLDVGRPIIVLESPVGLNSSGTLQG